MGLLATRIFGHQGSLPYVHTMVLVVLWSHFYVDDFSMALS